MSLNSDKIRKLVVAMQEQKRLSEIVLEEIDWRHRPAHATVKRQAEETLENLKQAYLGEISKGVMLVFCVGNRDKVAEFLAVVQQDGSIGVNIEEIYMHLALPIDRAIGRERTFTANSVSILNQGIYDFAKDLEIASMPSLVIPPAVLNTPVPTAESTLGIVKTILDGTYGIDLIKIYLRREVLKIATEIMYDQPVLPVFVSGVDRTATEVLGATAFDGHSLLLDFDTPNALPNEATLEKTFKAIKKHFVPTKKNEETTPETETKS